MPEPSFVWRHDELAYKGETKYYRTVSGGDVHADKNCYHLDGKQVEMVDEKIVNVSENSCSHCTTNLPDYRTLKAIAREIVNE